MVGRGGDRWGYSREVARDLWLFERDSGQATRLTRTGTASAPGWTPDGRRVVYVQDDPRQRDEVWTLPLDGSAEASRLVEVEGSLHWPVLTPDSRSPAWGPDSRHLHFCSGNVLGVAELRTTPTLTVAGRRIVAQLPHSCQDFDVAPDGKTFVVVVPASGRSDVLVAAHWTGELRRSWSQGAPAETAH